MKNWFTCITLAMLAWACHDTDLDFDKNPFTPGNGTEIIPDTVGINTFLGDKYIALTAKEQRFLYYAGQKGLLAFKAIALPESDNISRDSYPQEIQDVMFDCSNNNNFYGYPTATVVNGNPLVVFERRVSEKTVNDYSDGVFLSPDNNGKWQTTDFFKYAPFGFQFVNSRPMIVRTGDGKIVVKSQVGILVSNGDLTDWKHYPRAYEGVMDNTYTDLGANMAYSSKLGLFFGTGHRKMQNDTVKSAIFQVDYNSSVVTEVKKYWIPDIERNSVKTVIQEINGPVFYSVEASNSPDLAAYDGYIIGFSVFKEKIYQFVYAYTAGDTWDKVKFTVVQTTLQGSLSRQSPPGVIYNPVVKRFEMIQSTPYELALYSISPDSLLNCKFNAYGRAQWKKEAVLLQRNVTVRAQGMYPVSSMIDIEKNIQRVFIDMGDEYPARSGIFEITRSLNTGELSDFVRKKRAFIAKQLY